MLSIDVLVGGDVHGSGHMSVASGVIFSQTFFLFALGESEQNGILLCVALCL